MLKFVVQLVPLFICSFFQFIDITFAFRIEEFLSFPLYFHKELLQFPSLVRCNVFCITQLVLCRWLSVEGVEIVNVGSVRHG